MLPALQVFVGEDPLAPEPGTPAIEAHPASRAGDAAQRTAEAALPHVNGGAAEALHSPTANGRIASDSELDEDGPDAGTQAHPAAGGSETPGLKPGKQKQKRKAASAEGASPSKAAAATDRAGKRQRAADTAAVSGATGRRVRKPAEEEAADVGAHAQADAAADVHEAPAERAERRAAGSKPLQPRKKAASKSKGARPELDAGQGAGKGKATGAAPATRKSTRTQKSRTTSP